MSPPFRILFRLFLFRLTDVEFLSAHARGDSSKLLGQFAALLVFLSIVFSLPAGSVPRKDAHPQMRLIFEWSAEHFLIATTMLVVGLFAILNWEAVFPDRRDAHFAGALPVSTRTFFLAKIAAIAAALALSVGLLHVVAGAVWPLALNSEAPEFVVPSFRADPPVPITDQSDLGASVERALTPILRQRREVGIVVGVYQGGRRRIFAFGSARPDSIFEIGSVTKTFTGLLLARMVVEGNVRLDEPVRELLPQPVARKPYGAEITLLDLATHRSGLPSMPRGFRPADRENPFADFGESNLYAYLAARGFAKRGNPRVAYSNLGYGLLGHALASRAGRSYAALVEERIIGPLGLTETTVALDGGHAARLLQGHDWRHKPVPPLKLDAIAPAGVLHSTAADLLRYLEVQLHPSRVAASDPVLARALALAQQPRAQLSGDAHVALAWFIDTETNRVGHGGATIGHTAFVRFNRVRDEAVVVLSNTGPSTAISAGAIGEHVLAKIENRPAFAIEEVRIPARGGAVGFAQSFASYWTVMFTAGAFMFCSVLCLQGLAAQCLPRRLFLRVTPLLQLTAFVAIVAGYLLQPIVITAGPVLAAQSGGIQGWSPSFWFLGLLQQGRGSPMMALLAGRAWIACGVIGGLTIAVWVAAYFRTIRQIIEEPDIAPGRATRLPPLPWPGSSLDTAVAQFSLRTLIRSRQHRLILTFFAGVAFAVAIFFARTPDAQQEIAEVVVAGDSWREPTSPILASSLVILMFWMCAIRMAFAMPFEFGANWTFRVAPVAGGLRCLAAQRRAIYVAGLCPAWIVLSAACAAILPWKAALGHCLVLALVGAALAELCSMGAQKIPFTRSYLPGRTNLHVTFWLAVGLLIKILDTAAGWERQALEEPAALLAPLLVLLGLITVLVRWIANRAAVQEETAGPQFEAEPLDAIVLLGIDGSVAR